MAVVSGIHSFAEAPAILEVYCWHSNWCRQAGIGEVRLESRFPVQFICGVFPDAPSLLDANATTPLLPEVMEAMRPYWMEHFGNASSIHLQGQRARKAVDGARETLAKFFHCREAEVVFNSGGTEGDNTAIFGLVRAGDHLITTAIEHRRCCALQSGSAERGAEVTFVAPRRTG